ILHIGGKLADIAEDSEIARRFHGAMNINVALHGRMPGNAALQVGAYQRVEVKMLELDCDLARKVVTQVQAAFNIQSGILKIRLGPQQHLCPVGFRLRIQVAYFFTTEHQMMDAQLRIDGWRFKRSGPGNTKIRIAGHREPLRLKTAEVS